MKFLFMCIALLATIAYVSSSMVTMIRDARCVGMKARVNEKNSIAYTYCCDGGFSPDYEFPDYATIKYVNDCNKVLDEQIPILNAGKVVENCKKNVYEVDT